MIPPPGLNLMFQKDPVLPSALQRLPDAGSHAVFVLSLLIEKKKGLTGPSYHLRMADLLQGVPKTEEEWTEWLREGLKGVPWTGKSLDSARKKADLWIQDGRWVGAWTEGTLPPSHGLGCCPRIVFGKGTMEPDRFWAVCFNSRKPRIASPRAEWLRILRTMLPVVGSMGMGLAGSLGTITYDLVTAGAEREGSELLLVLDSSLDDIAKSSHSAVFDAESFPSLILTCLPEAGICPKSVRMTCRDRLLAFLSDLHCILELRSGGCLLKTIEAQQKEAPRFQWIYRPEESNKGNAGNLKLLGEASSLTISFSSEDPAIHSETLAPEGMLHYRHDQLDAGAIRWDEYLFHYTRSCPGPWPNQSYREYLLGLLDNDPLAERTALAVLVRILVEGRIRASSKVVRGDQAVVSWTSRPPQELGAIRRWNPALIRWTFEPYGIAVKRDILRRLGARPAIYAASAVYEKLRREDRFRFQLHHPSRSSWKNEQEWRIPHDLDLTQVPREEAFAFVPVSSDLEMLRDRTSCFMPVLVLNRGD